MKWAVIIATLKMALPFLNMAQVMIANFDSNDEGIDDKIADGVRKGIDAIVYAIESDPSVPGQAKGLVEITAFSNAVLARLTAISESETITGEMKTEAQMRTNSLNDPQQVFQPKRGKDADVLNNAKARASTLNSQIQAR